MHVHVSLHRRESIRWTSHSPISVACFSMACSGFYQVSKRRGRMRSSVFLQAALETVIIEGEWKGG
jgi:hypothetical protein